MTETPPVDGARTRPPPKSPLFQNNRLIRTIGFVVVLISVIVASGSFLIMSGATRVEPSPDVWTWI